MAVEMIEHLQKGIGSEGQVFSSLMLFSFWAVLSILLETSNSLHFSGQQPIMYM